MPNDKLQAGLLLQKIGNFMQGRIQESFRNQARGGFVWRERKVPNIAGIISDLNRGSSIKPHRFNSRPALRDSGTLLKSIAAPPEITVMSVVVGSGLPYASQLQTGGISTIDVKSGFRKNLAKYYRSHKKQFKKYGLGWLFSLGSGDKHKVNIPSRPFAIILQRDLDDIVIIIKEHFKRILGGGK